MAESWCRICGKKYKVCPHCETARERTPWRIVTDTAVHYQIWVAVSQYKSKIISKEEAREMLSRIAYDRAEEVNFIPAIRDIINEIMTPEKSEATPKRKSRKRQSVTNVSGE